MEEIFELGGVKDPQDKPLPGNPLKWY